MADPTTSNMQLSVPTRGSDTGTWDTPVNGNFTITDAAFGGIATVSVSSAGTISLPSSATQCSVIRVTGALTTNFSVITSSLINKTWALENLTTGSSQFTVSFISAASTGSIICFPPGECADAYFDGTTMKYRNLDRVGAYWDLASFVVPVWVTSCTVPPYLNCNGTSFSSATYPALAALIGTTLPDSRGRGRIALNQGTGRVTSGISGIDGNTLIAAGGDQSLQTHSHTNTLTDPGHNHLVIDASAANAFVGAGAANVTPGSGLSVPVAAVNMNSNNSFVTGAHITNITINNANTGSGSAQNMPPSYVGGITMIRAA